MICIVALLLLLMPAALAGGLLDSALGWDASVADVEAWLGAGVERVEQHMGDYGDAVELIQDGATVLGFDDSLTSAIFYDDKLVEVDCYFDAEAQAVADKLAETCGAPVYADHDQPALMDFLEDRSDLFCSWQPDDATTIELYQFTDESYPYRCVLSIDNSPAWAEFQRALGAFYGMDD